MSEKNDIVGPPVRYKADSEGRVYAEFEDGSSCQTGWIVPGLRSQSNISPAAFIAHIQNDYAGGLS